MSPGIERDVDSPVNGESESQRARSTPSPRPATATKASAPAKPSKLASLLPGWVMAALKDKRMWKNWARCMIALFVSMLLMTIKPSLDALGLAAFFALIAAIILPPSMPLSIFVFALFTMGFGMLLGWAWGTAAWAASLSVRDQALIQSKTQMVRQQAQAAGINNQVAAQGAIFKGVFLDPRSSAVCGVFIFIGCYFFAWVRAAKPKLTLLSIFGTIILDMTCSFAPLFPQQYYVLPTTLLKPAAAYMAVAIVCTILFFPQSLNHLTVSTLVHQCLTPMLDFLKVQESSLDSDPDNHEEWHALAEKSRGMAALFMTTFAALEGQAKMLQLEVTRGRISAGQLSELISRTRLLGRTAIGIGTVVSMVDERYSALKDLADSPLPHSTEKTTAIHQTIIRAEKDSGRNYQDLLPDLKAETAELRDAANTAFQGGIDYLEMINNRRWRSGPKDFPGIETRKANLQRLNSTLAEFRKSGTSQMLSKFRDYFDPETGKLLEWHGKAGGGSPRGLFRSFQFTATLTSFCVALVDWLALLEVIELENPKNKFQFPGKFVHEIVRNVNDKGSRSNNYDLSIQDDLIDHGGVVDDDESTLHDGKAGNTKDRKHAKGDKGADLKAKYCAPDPDAGPPNNAFQKVGRPVAVVLRGMTGENGIYALKYGIVTIALWIPAVHPSSAEFVYKNRGLWALIMAQLGLGVFTGEQVYNFVSRMTGTVIGVIFGMVLWYIGAQKGLGRAYGVTAATMVGMAPLLFLRIAAPPHVMGFWIMLAVTVVFVVGYSWVDNHVPQTANQGAGYTLAGRRALLVFIGFVASFIMILIPHPISAKKVVRQGVAKNIAALSDLYAFELAGLEEGRNEDPQSIEVNTDRRMRFRGHMLRIFGRLQALRQRIAFASFEPATRGPWPKEKYVKIVRIQEAMLGASALLTAASSQLEPQWCRRITDDSDFMHPAFVADCISLFTILRHSLRQATPLPPIIPIFERLSYHREYRYARNRVLHNLKQEHVDDGPDGDLLPNERAALASLKHDLTWENAHDEQFTIYATAQIAIAHFLGGLNALHAEVLTLVGEREIEGFDIAQERWAQAELVV